jgi:hypothetical protein
LGDKKNQWVEPERNEASYAWTHSKEDSRVQRVKDWGKVRSVEGDRHVPRRKEIRCS